MWGKYVPAKNGNSEHTVSLQFLMIWLHCETGACLGNDQM